VAIEPGGSLARELGDGSGAFVGGAEIIEGKLERRLKGSERPELGGSAGHIEDPERVVGEVGVAPDPEFLPAMEGCLNAVAAKDSAFLPVEVFA